MRRIDLEPAKAKMVVLACCILHNMIRKGKPPPTATIPSEPRPTNIETDDAQQLPGLEPLGLRPAEGARLVRDQFCEYFNTVGAVPWQDNLA